MDKTSLIPTQDKDEESYEVIYLSFTDLYEIKQQGLEDLLMQGKKVFLLSKKIAPIKLSMVDLSNV